MHINVHYAIGIIVASLTTLFYPLNFWTFSFIVGCAFIADFDIFLKKYAKDGNHRMLFTHSIYISLILIILGFIISQTWVIMGGVAYFIHIMIDLLDWGTNFFYNNKMFGFRLLLSLEERKDLSHVLDDEENRQLFFVQRYYSSRIMIFIEIIIGISMLVSLFLYAINYWYFIFGYIIFFAFHSTEYIELRNRKLGKKPGIPLINH